jgi:hypothetical protein
MAISSTGMADRGEGALVAGSEDLDASAILCSAALLEAANRERIAAIMIVTNVSGGDCNNRRLCRNTVPICHCISQPMHF